MNRVEWDPENETYAEFKKRRSASFGISGMGQKKREGTGKKNHTKQDRVMYRKGLGLRIRGEQEAPNEITKQKTLWNR